MNGLKLRTGGGLKEKKQGRGPSPKKDGVLVCQKGPTFFPTFEPELTPPLYDLRRLKRRHI